VTGNVVPNPWLVLVMDKLIIGAILVCAGWVLNRKLEAFKAAQARLLEASRVDAARQADAHRALDERRKEWSRETRAAIADLTSAMAACNQEIAWLTWRARYLAPARLDQKRIEDYDAAVKVSLTALFSSRVRLAALDERAHATLTPCIDELYRLDTVVAERAADLESADASARLGALYADAQSLYNSLLAVVSGVLRDLAIRRGLYSAEEDSADASCGDQGRDSLSVG
jgi:hypothetical protein